MLPLKSLAKALHQRLRRNQLHLPHRFLLRLLHHLQLPQHLLQPVPVPF
jgi:hypothetical protein